MYLSVCLCVCVCTQVSKNICKKKYVLSNSESVQCNFFIFDHVTFIQFKICCCVQNFNEISTKSDDFSPRYGDILIFKMAAVRHLGIVLPPYETSDHPRSLLLAAAACQISNTQIWRYSYLNYSHIWLEMPIQVPKMGVWGTLDP